MLRTEKEKILVKVPCREEVRRKFYQRFGEKCEFVFTEDYSGDVAECKTLKSREEFLQNCLRDTEVIIGEPDEAELQQAENLKWLQITWAGADKYTKMQNIRRDFVLTNASGAFGIVISEYVIGSIIALYRSFPAYQKKQRNHVWEKGNSVDTLFGKKVLILGTGDIGKNVAARLRPFGVHITGVKRNVAGIKGKTDKECKEYFDEIFSIDELDRILPNMDIVTGCLPGTKETAGLFNAARLRTMKKDAVLINVGRGSLIVNDDLVRILSAGHLKGAVLDVSETEPLAEESPLWDMENVILTPHIAGPSFGGDRMTENLIWDICLQNLERFLEGKELCHRVNLEAGY